MDWNPGNVIREPGYMPHVGRMAIDQGESFGYRWDLGPLDIGREDELETCPIIYRRFAFRQAGSSCT